MTTNFINESDNFFNIDFFSHPKPSSADNIRTSTLLSNQMNLEDIDMKDFLINVKTHQGSISYQHILNGLTPEEINTFLLKLCPYLIEIMCSHYGNYFIQKLFLKLSVNQRLLIFSIIKNNFIQLCANKSGTYSIQSLIDMIKTPKEEEILQSLLQNHLVFPSCNTENHYRFPRRKKKLYQ